MVHIHAEGPAFFCWIPKLFGKRVICTIHGLDWDREKWRGSVASKFIRGGEKNAVKYADEIIVLSKDVQKYFLETYGRETHFIPNGVNRPEVREAKLITDHFGLEKDSYILFLGRLVPEKGIRYLVEAFKNVKTDKKLVIAGGSSDTDSFMEELKELAKGDDRILFTGFVQGAKGHEIIEFVRSGINRWYRFKMRSTGKLNLCDYIMFANRETREFLGLGENVPLVTEIAADEVSIEKRTISNDINHELVFLFAGRMVYRKGLDLLFDAIMEIPNEWKYIVKIVGTGPEFSHLKHRCESNSLLAAHIQFMGAVQYSEMQREYELSDVLIMPSIRETTGTVLIEAMSQGIPIITINKFGGAILVDENTGWLYSGENRKSYIDGLKNAMVACIVNPKEVKRRGQNARKKVKEYTWKRKCEQYEKIYKRLNCVD